MCDCAVTGCEFLFTHMLTAMKLIAHSLLLNVLVVGIAKTSFVIESWSDIVYAFS